MTPAAIREGFSHLRDGASMQPLADAAVCRSESDWLVGINGTRAMTAFNSKTGGFQLTTVGRVQTPTLAIVVEREEKIKKFVPRDYWELHATFAAKAGEYVGRWFDENFSREKRDGDAEPQARTNLERPTRRGHPPEMRWQAGNCQRREQAGHPAFAVALRLDKPSARLQQPPGLLRQEYPGAWPRHFTNAIKS